MAADAMSDTPGRHHNRMASRYHRIVDDHDDPLIGDYRGQTWYRRS